MGYHQQTKREKIKELTSLIIFYGESVPVPFASLPVPGVKIYNIDGIHGC